MCSHPHVPIHSACFFLAVVPDPVAVLALMSRFFSFWLYSVFTQSFPQHNTSCFTRLLVGRISILCPRAIQA